MAFRSKQVEFPLLSDDTIGVAGAVDCANNGTAFKETAKPKTNFEKLKARIEAFLFI